MFSKLFGKKDSNSYTGKPKERRSKENKKEKWKRYPKRLLDALNSNAHDNDLEGLKENLDYYKDLFLYDKNNWSFLLETAIKNNSKECAEYLLLFIDVEVNTTYLLKDCKYEKMIEVYHLLEYLVSKYPKSFKYELDKKILIKRLIEPYKIDSNPKRLDFLLENLDFFGVKNLQAVMEEVYTEKPEKKSRLSSVIRDIKLKELGL